MNKKPTLRDTIVGLESLLADGLVEEKIVDGKPSYRITQRGIKHVENKMK